MQFLARARIIRFSFSILVAGIGKRKVLYASLQNESVRSMMISIEERLAESAPCFTSQFVGIPGVNESAKASLLMDIEGSPPPGIIFVAITSGTAEMLQSTMFRTGFADFLPKVWKVIRDEGQQAGLGELPKTESSCPSCSTQKSFTSRGVARRLATPLPKKQEVDQHQTASASLVVADGR